MGTPENAVMNDLVVANATTTWHDGGTALFRPNGEIIAMASERVADRFKHTWDSRPAYEYLRKRLPNEIFGGRLDGFRDTSQGLENTDHHLYHAANSFYFSGFSQAAILVVDGQGPEGDHLSCTTIWRGHRSRGLDLVEDIHPSTGVFAERSVGHFYSAVGALAGMKELFCEGRTMALASYGRPSPFLDRLRADVCSMPDGRYEINPLLTRSILAHTLGRWFYQWPAPAPEEAAVWTELQKLRSQTDARWPSQDDMDIAFAGQRLLEEIMLGLAARVRDLTGEQRLCIAGGVGLNCVANEKVRRSGSFDEVFVGPTPSDDGQAMGRLFLELGSHGIPIPIPPTAYLGLSYGPDEIERAIEQFSSAVEYTVTGTTEELVRRVAGLIAERKVVGWFQGRSELGPRALGNRSILADPRDRRMRDRLNDIKGRAWYRPIGPVIPLDRMPDFFVHGLASPFMSFAVQTREEATETIPAAVHVDGTARVQTVTRSENALLYELITEFERRTAVPVLLNTSFNRPDEPIVETPVDALRTFLRRRLDVLVLGHTIVLPRRRDMRRTR